MQNGELFYRAGVDIGGTFTDCVLVDDHGQVTIGKSPTVRENPADGVMNALGAVAEIIGLDRPTLLSRLSFFVHGNTIGTNALIERTGARTGLLTTLGHEDSILIGRTFSKRAGLSERQIIHTSKLNKPEPIVPRRLIAGVPERIDAEGEVLVRLDEDALLNAVQSLVDDGIEALAICFLWGFRNPVHERRARDLIVAKWPDLPVTLSSDVAPILGEYERTVTTVLNAYLQPRIESYLAALEARLRDEGFREELLVIQSGGGLASVKHVARKAVMTIDSGPAGGTLGSRFFGKQFGEENLICTDVGGTSFDVGLVHQGELQLETDPVIRQYVYRAPKILVKSIGAGGGSVVWLDDLGVMHVGPRSAGARPGPACYGHGGTLPTVTDANLILGFLNPDNFLGGRMKLHRELADQAFAPIAAKLGKSVLDTAWGVYEIINAHMADLIRTMTIEQGYDPRDFAVLAYGGAGATHAVGYSADIGAKALYVPREATVFSALGMLTADMVHTAEGSHPLITPLSEQDVEGLNQILRELEASVVRDFQEEQIGKDRVDIRRTIFMRYKSQVHELGIDAPNRDMSVADEKELLAQFRQRYAAIYGQGAVLDASELEILTLRVEGRAVLEKPNVTARTRSEGSELSTRRLYFGPKGMLDAKVFDGNNLAPGSSFPGPAVIERYGDAVLVPPGYAFQTDRFENIVISNQERQ